MGIFISAVVIVLAVCAARTGVGARCADAARELLMRHILNPFGTPASLRRVLLRRITGESIVMPSGTVHAAATITQRLAPEDLDKLHPLGDAAAIGADLTDVYASHAELEGWIICAPPKVIIEIDGRLRPGWVPAARLTAPVSVPRRSLVVERPNIVYDAPGGTRPLVEDAPSSEEPTRPVFVLRSDAETHRLTGPVIAVGRAPDAALRIEDDNVSWRHAVIEHHDGTWTIRDLASKNGTRVDGSLLRPDTVTPLRPHSTITLGSTQLTAEASE